MTPFENRLAAVPPREIPAELRDRILGAARPRPSSLAVVASFLRAIFSFPHPLAWGAVGACWAAITILNFSGPRGEELYTVTPKGYKGRLPSPQEYLVETEAQRRLLAALVEGDLEPRPAYRLRPQDL